MPFPPGFTRLVAQGELGRTEDDVEIWSCGIAVSSQKADYSAELPLLWDYWANYISQVASPFYNNCRLTEVMAGAILPDGKISGGGYQRYAEAPVSGALGAPYAPFQQSLCITLDAGGVTRGRYGRFYPPPQAIELPSGTGLVSEVSAGAAVDAAVTLLSSIASLSPLSPDFNPVVLSSAGATGSGRPVVEVRAGRVFDTVRRRRNKLGEGYIVRPFSPPTS